MTANTNWDEVKDSPVSIDNLVDVFASGDFANFVQNRVDTGVTWEDIYPVGAVYISFKNISPAFLFGGSWTQITGSFLRMANDVSTGGADTVKLTTSQMPSHSHSITEWQISSFNTSGYLGRAIGGKLSSSTSVYTNTAGGTDSFSNMPAYQDLYAWRRTA